MAALQRWWTRLQFHVGCRAVMYSDEPGHRR
jgi:hypothetical protein